MKCPCENCIVFPMCKNRLFGEYRKIVMDLSNSCPLLKNYLCVQRNVVTLNRARELFGLLKGSFLNYE